MKKIIKRVPLPLCGVMLGTAALGNLLQSYSEGIRYLCGVMAGILLVFLLLKLFCFPQKVKEDLNNPIMASVAGTFPMALMILSTYVKPFLGSMSFLIWIAAIMLHVLLIVYFTVKFMLPVTMKKVFASYYIVYVGIAVAAITAPAYDKTGIGTAAFWFGLVLFVLLFLLVTIRYVKCPDVPEPAKPLLCIYAAPMSLCLAGYIQSVMPKSYGFLMGMFVVAFILYLFALIQAVGFLKLPFYPSYAAFTFPFVISAIASKQTMACVAKMGHPMPILSYLVLAETIIAAVLVVYTLVRFLQFLFLEQ